MSDKDKIKSTQVLEIVLEANPGANLNYCIQDTLRRALSEKKLVKLIYNGRVFTANYDDLFNLVLTTQQDITTIGATHEPAKL